MPRWPRAWAWRALASLSHDSLSPGGVISWVDSANGVRSLDCGLVLLALAGVGEVDFGRSRGPRRDQGFLEDLGRITTIDRNPELLKDIRIAAIKIGKKGCYNDSENVLPLPHLQVRAQNYLQCDCANF